MTLKLCSITFDKAPRIPGLRLGDMITLECDNPATSMRGWRALIRGNSLFLVSPPGWRPGGRDTDASAPSIIHEIPRLSCYLHWTGEDADVDKVSKFTSPPFGPPDVPVDAASADMSAPTPKSLLSQVPGFGA